MEKGKTTGQVLENVMSTFMKDAQYNTKTVFSRNDLIVYKCDYHMWEETTRKGFHFFTNFPKYVNLPFY